MNPLRSLAAVLLAVILPVASARAAITPPTVVDAVFDSATTVPVTAASYTAADNTLNLALDFAPPTGTSLTVINNTGPSHIAGRFSNLAQGQTVAVVYNNATYKFVANYYGGTGNDLVLVWAANRVCGWGRNDAGQLGTGSTSASSNTAVLTSPGALAGKTVVAVVAGISHSLALCADGSLVGWGTVPTVVPLVGALAGKPVVAIAGGGYHYLALCADGTVAAWGSNEYGQLGDGTRNYHAVPVAVLTNGALAGKVVTAIAASHDHSLALCQDGTVVAWGRNLYGKLGDGTNTMRTSPVAVATSTGMAGRTVTAIAAGRSFSLALCSDGAMFSWGGNHSGELGIGRPDPYAAQVYASYTPVKVLDTGVLAGKAVVAIGTASDGAAAVLADGRIATWGFPLGTGTTSVSVEPVLANNTSGVLGGKPPISARGGEGFIVAFAKGNACAWGYNDYGKLGNGTTTSNYQPVAVSTSSLGSGYQLVDVNTGPGASHTLGIVAVPLGAVATLSALAATPGTLSPAFSSGTTNYTLTVPGDTPAVSLPPTVTDPNATIQINGVAVASGSPGPVIPLGAGSVTVTVRVTAQNGIAATTYTVRLNRMPVFPGYTLSTPYQTQAAIQLSKLLAKTNDADGDAFTVIAAGPTSAKGGTALLQSGRILYTPPTAASGTDTFPVTIRDARGAATIGTVTVTVGHGPDGGGVGVNPPVLTSLPDGKMGLAFHGIPGRSYLVQRSASGLDNWVTLATIPADASGKVAYTDESPPAGSAFYRLGLP